MMSRKGLQRLGPILLIVLYAFVFVGCMLDRMGIAPPCVATIDPLFHGCFERPAGSSPELMLIRQETCNLLHGHGSGLSELFAEPDGIWTLSGRVTEIGVALLVIRNDTEAVEVTAIRERTSAGETLSLQREGRANVDLRNECP